MTRTLRLHRDTLSELSTADLTGVVGAADYSREGFTCPQLECVRGLTVLPNCNAWTFSGC